MLKNWKTLYWLLVLTFLLIPVANSFVVSVKNVVDSYKINVKHKESLSNLSVENRKLLSKIKYYKSNEGKKALVKDRLHMVDKGEILIKYHSSNAQN